MRKGAAWTLVRQSDAKGPEAPAQEDERGGYDFGDELGGLRGDLLRLFHAVRLEAIEVHNCGMWSE